jgi:cytochrome-b5 reductase
MLQVIDKIFDNPQDNTVVSLVFGNISEEDILLKDKLDYLAKKFPDRLHVYYTLDKPNANWTGGKPHR